MAEAEELVEKGGPTDHAIIRTWRANFSVLARVSSAFDPILILLENLSLFHFGYHLGHCGQTLRNILRRGRMGTLEYMRYRNKCNITAAQEGYCHIRRSHRSGMGSNDTPKLLQALREFC